MWCWELSLVMPPECLGPVLEMRRKKVFDSSVSESRYLVPFDCNRLVEVQYIWTDRMNLPSYPCSALRFKAAVGVRKRTAGK